MEKEKGVRFLKLPFQFNVEKLQNELQTIVTSKWNDHFNKTGYEGSWKSIALYAENGDENNIYASIEKVKITETPFLKECPYLKEVINTFKSLLISVRLLNLEKGSKIKPHRDYKLGYEDNCFRIHVPIITNNKVTFLLDDEIVDMKVGECWYTNVNYIHSVSNLGDTDRIHLVIDLERNQWSDNLFFSLAEKERFFILENSSQVHDKATIQQMINELKLQNTPASKELIIQLENQLLIK
ncbi:aspartyl/asparaginyl beta-hydroxylase domain-containing protein [Tenacibaculum sp. E3R01]|uniref:aspartyl/asparaginyl beta-hydroxylase domain-containing protein n=1 Tax=Tenacibaculum sp. E3R01 TaxID=2267227 RepID=UPI000DEA9ADB|nr:aspartyl/asparaginyl beta-hydroxylase domain-containing protein [Tenacibaculum sp. E3R01]RBW60812.1 aspartyl/asparaginyl beta-hydroxylase domain-containing protein [Tenacibaculum sp. E3R01]